MTEFIRQSIHAYEDPLALVWLTCAARVGFTVLRSRDAYASSDGQGRLLIATEDQFDPDDNLGQMILHELCHALVEGEAGEALTDWGLDNTRMGNPWREHACLRLQAWLADSVGLRDFFAPTTDFRVSFWASLPADPFAAPATAGGRRERSCVAARVGAWRAGQSRWAPHLTAALKASAQIAACLPRGDVSQKPDEPDKALPSLWTTVVPPPPRHPAGHAPVADYHRGQACGDCAWSFLNRGRVRCRHAPGVPLPDPAPACSRYEPAAELDCQTCGACCREAYDSVEVSIRDPVNRTHPELVIVHETHRKLRRLGHRCAALTGGDVPTEPFACSIYPQRPRTCREFTRGSAHCLDARRRVGLSL
jgi:hypothetical protein